jgi:single-strand DNA-binding protein
MLRVTLLGNLGADPDQRFTAKGAQLVVFNVAVNQVRRGPDGERQESTEWFRVNVSGPRAEFAQRLSRGSRVMVIGRLSISHYTSKDGEPRTGFDVWADEIEPMSQRPRDPEALVEAERESAPEAVESHTPVAAGAGSARGRTAIGRGTANGAATTPIAETEDLPF